jgi:hypothetical protein
MAEIFKLILDTVFRIYLALLFYETGAVGTEASWRLC